MEHINEDETAATSAGDVAIQPSVIGTQHRGIPCFDIQCKSEFNGFNRGIKTYRQWRRHVKSEEIRQWANKNPYKDFYIHNDGTYIKVSRGKRIPQ